MTALPSTPLRIGNAQGFWGDDPDAPARLAAQAPDMDYLTLDYLAEVSMSILATQQMRDPAAGYARDFIEVIRALAPVWIGGRKLRVVTNAGGLNPRGCADAVVRALHECGCGGLRIGVVTGDNVLPHIQNNAYSPTFNHLESCDSVATRLTELVTANAYLGAGALVEALNAGADIVITGRVADPSLTVAPCIAHYGWSADDYDRIAGATVAGHLIECGTQVCGGISTEWLSLPDAAHIGFPIVEVDADGSCVVTKPAGTGGRVDTGIVKEQLLYELGDPANYLSPDATVSFLTLAVEQVGKDRVRVSGATGRAPPGTYKVSATYRAGFRAAGTLTVYGHDAAAKARRSAQIIRQRLRDAGCEPQRWRDECLGVGDAAPVRPATGAGLEAVLRVAVADSRREVVERFTKELMPLITSGPQGITGYAEGRPKVHQVFGYWPCLIERERLEPKFEIVEV